jgi:hypothetical protein
MVEIVGRTHHVYVISIFDSDGYNPMHVISSTFRIHKHMSPMHVYAMCSSQTLATEISDFTSSPQLIASQQECATVLIRNYLHHYDVFIIIYEAVLCNLTIETLEAMHAKYVQIRHSASLSCMIHTSMLVPYNRKYYVCSL